MEISAQELKNMIGDIISLTIDEHRSSADSILENSELLEGSATEEEIDEFIFHNPLLDEELVERLLVPGLLGFFHSKAVVTDEWMNEFRQNILNWSRNQSWLAADEPMRKFVDPWSERQSDIWNSKSGIEIPNWARKSPTYLLVAADLLNKGKHLSEIHWRDFENLIGELLEKEGWTVDVTRASKDGGIDVIAVKKDLVFGDFKSVWQAKKYGSKNKVQLCDVRELSALRDDQKATKGVIVTTSHLTRGAIDWIRRDSYRMDYKDKDQMEKWIRKYI